jgi:hypothetical protein
MGSPYGSRSPSMIVTSPLSPMITLAGRSKSTVMSISFWMIALRLDLLNRRRHLLEQRCVDATATDAQAEVEDATRNTTSRRRVSLRFKEFASTCGAACAAIPVSDVPVRDAPECRARTTQSGGRRPAPNGIYAGDPVK